MNASTARHYAAAFDPASGAATAWNPAPNAEVYAIRPIGSTVYLGGAFTSVAGQTRSGAAAVDDGTGTTPTDWNPKITGSVYQLAVSGSSIYAAGSFQTVNDTTSRDNVGLFNTTTGAPIGGFAPVVGGDVFALGVGGGTVVAGGSFRAVGSGDPLRFRRDNLGALDLGTGQSTNWAPDDERRRLRAGRVGLDRLRGRRLHARQRIRDAQRARGVRRRPTSAPCRGTRT